MQKMEKAEKRKYGFGTGEWAKKNVNIGFGCPHNCRYCYAKMFAIRYKRKTEETWKVMEPNFKAINKARLAFWEPNAPSFDDRMNSLMIASLKEFKTSVSIEPYLDLDPTNIILKVAPYCSRSIWLGIMNYIKVNGITEEEKPYYDYQRKISSWSHVQKIVEKIKLLPEDVKSKIRIKDSIVKMYKKHGIEVKI